MLDFVKVRNLKTDRLPDSNLHPKESVGSWTSYPIPLPVNFITHMELQMLVAS